ncbi:MAG: hypothetical protein OXM61_03265 [Candidatus Poribacteria bacterium]|nr:hypothetical protein [Candidatus Poribacteria bacterium]
MNRQKYWGLGVLIILLIAAGGFMYWQWSTVQQMKEQLAEDKPMLEEKEKPVAENNPPVAREGFKMVPHGDHWHEVPIDAPDMWQGEPHAPIVEVSNETKQSSVPALPDISSLPKLADDIDPDDIPAFSITGPGGEVYNYNRPLTPEEREMYFKLKSDISYWNSTPAGIKMSAIISVREQKVKEGALHPFFEDWGKGILTDEELERKIAEFYEMTR